MPPVSISTETAAIHSNPTRPATSPNKTCKSVSSATTKPARASHLGSTPVLNATREVTSTIADAPIWQKWYSHEASVKDTSTNAASGSKTPKRCRAAGKRISAAKPAASSAANKIPPARAAAGSAPLTPPPAAPRSPSSAPLSSPYNTPRNKMKKKMWKSGSTPLEKTNVPNPASK
jgi:hypothetical protein